jgi:ABC-2 type transport system permease protein
MIALVRRELSAYFISPMAYIILTAMLAVSGFTFYSLMLGYAQTHQPAQMGGTLNWLVFLLTLVCPLITMRLIAEEKNRGTIETMMTAPIGEWQFVLAKYVAAVLFVAYLLLPTSFYAAFIGAYGWLDFKGMLAGYLGVMLTLGAVLSIGLFISSLASNQITAGVVTLIVAISLMTVSALTGSLKPGTSMFLKVARNVLNYLAILNHVEEFSKGVIDTRPLVYLLSVSFLFLFLTVRVIESRRWR